MEPLEERALLDATGPHVLSHTPSEIRNDVFDHIDITFNEAIDEATFTVDDVNINSLSGEIDPTSISPVGGNTYRISFPVLTVRGNYQAVVGSDIADVAGNLMDQNQDGISGEPSVDAYQAGFVYVNAGTIFTTDFTISETDTVYENEDLLIDGATVTIDGSHAFNSVHLVNGAVLTHTANTYNNTHKLDLTVTEQVTVDATSKIDVSGRGYLGSRTIGNSSDGAATRNSGGSYGGSGRTQYGQTNAAYWDYANPDDWGSGGAGPTGGSGGGLVRIVAGTLALDGQVLANGRTDQRPRETFEVSRAATP